MNAVSTFFYDQRNKKKSSTSAEKKLNGHANVSLITYTQIPSLFASFLLKSNTNVFHILFFESNENVKDIAPVIYLAFLLFLFIIVVLNIRYII